MQLAHCALGRRPPRVQQEDTSEGCLGREGGGDGLLHPVQGPGVPGNPGAGSLGKQETCSVTPNKKACIHVGCCRSYLAGCLNAKMRQMKTLPEPEQVTLGSGGSYSGIWDTWTTVRSLPVYCLQIEGQTLYFAPSSSLTYNCHIQ